VDDNNHRTEEQREIVLVGPFWTRSETTEDLGCTEECLLGRHDVLRIGARFSQEVYPTFQFDHHHVRADVADIVELLLRKDVTGAVISDWLVHANPDLDGESPLQWLDRGQPEEEVLDSARRSVPALRAATAELRSRNLPYEGHYGPE
jgi:hypothetical protein